MMATKPYNRYSYEDLRAAATAEDAQQIDIDTLGAWFHDYGGVYWNGEYYDADNGLRLRPVFEWDDELDQGHVVHYEFI